jgi:TonB-linked SusC/RagA family outer membrane protein
MQNRKEITIGRLLFGYLTALTLSLLVPAMEAFPQTGNTLITGTIMNQKNEPLAGVSIAIHGSYKGTVTDATGEFKLTVEKSAGLVLDISTVGYQKQSVVVGSQTQLKISMREASGSLNDVVVIGYGTQRKANVTGAVSTLSASKIENIAVGNVNNSLIGRLPGLIAVNRGGPPGDDASQLSIRGFDNMLSIVDGVPNSFGDLDPNEIDNITILKDASAAIYGARAGNGVILVTTKRGKSGAPLFNVNASYGQQAPTRIAHQVDAATYARMTNEAQVAAGSAPIYTDAEIQKYKDGTDPAYPNTNWYNEVFNKSAPIAQYNVNASGGNDQIRYFISGSYMDQEGLFKSGDIYYKRYNIRSNLDANISKYLSVSLLLSGSIQDRNQPGGSVAQVLEDLTFSQPTFAAHYPDPTKLTYTGHLSTQPIGRSNSEFSGYSNAKLNVFNGILSLKYEMPFLPGLSARGTFSYNSDNGFNKAFGKQFLIYGYDAPTDAYTQVGVGQNSKTQLDETYVAQTQNVTQISLNYTKKAGNHEFGALLLGEFIQADSSYLTSHREGFITTSIDQLFAGSNVNQTTNGSANEDGRTGYAGRLTYAYSGKYLIDFTMRADASARYATNERWGYFPGVSAGWRISKEDFMDNVSFVNDLKLRASWGKAGNDYVGRFNYLTGYNFGAGNVFGESPVLQTGIVSKGLANPDLTWENTAISDIGLDGVLWKGGLSFTVDVFYRKVTNVAGYRSQSLPSTFGAVLPLENLNSYDNRGFELSLRHEQRIGDFRLAIDGNVTYTRAKWIHYDEPTYPDDETRQRLQMSGQWQNRFFGYKALGLFQSQDEINKWNVIQDGNNNTTLRPGDIKYEDYNHDGILDYRDNHVIGQGFTPEIFYALNFDLHYKGFDFSMLWQGAANNNAYFGGLVSQPFSNGNVPFSYLTDYWTPSNPGAKYPRLYPGGAFNNTYVSSFWLQNADYLRLKNIQFGYTFPAKIISKAGVTKLRVFVAAYNILTFDSVQPYDPETGSTNNGQFYPQQKSYNIGINLSF